MNPSKGTNNRNTQRTLATIGVNRITLRDQFKCLLIVVQSGTYKHFSNNSSAHNCQSSPSSRTNACDQLRRQATPHTCRIHEKEPRKNPRMELLSEQASLTSCAGSILQPQEEHQLPCLLLVQRTEEHRRLASYNSLHLRVLQWHQHQTAANRRTHRVSTVNLRKETQLFDHTVLWGTIMQFNILWNRRTETMMLKAQAT